MPHVIYCESFDQLHLSKILEDPQAAADSACVRKEEGRP